MSAGISWEVNGMRIEPYDSPLRFLVSSQVEGESQKYLIQLDSFWATGECSCPDFEFRHRPILVRERHNNCEELRCKHIRAVREAFCSNMVRLLSEQESRRPQMR